MRLFIMLIAVLAAVYPCAAADIYATHYSNADKYGLYDRWYRPATIKHENNTPATVLLLGSATTVTWGYDSSYAALLDLRASKEALIQRLHDLTAELSGVSGLTLQYEPTVTHAYSTGTLGSNPDIAITINTNISGLASAYRPDDGTVLLKNVTTGKSTIKHEFLHALGLQHVDEVPSLMPPSRGSSSNRLTPQFDDIAGLHQLYGDIREKTGGVHGGTYIMANNGGNDTFAMADSLGTVAPGAGIQIGEHAADLEVAVDERDLVSINKRDDLHSSFTVDTDVYTFEVTQDGYVSIVLAPIGPTYSPTYWANYNKTKIPNAETIDAKRLYDLHFKLLDDQGNVIQIVDAAVLGEAESLLSQLTAGTYGLEISGVGDTTVMYEGTAADKPQFYQLDITMNAIPEPMTLGVLALGGLAILQRRRRTRS